jgi:hypothetical protein
MKRDRPDLSEQRGGLWIVIRVIIEASAHVGGANPVFTLSR